jgi:hypothetical protein
VTNDNDGTNVNVDDIEVTNDNDDNNDVTNDNVDGLRNCGSTRTKLLWMN